MGDMVTATVVWAGEKGMRAVLEADDSIKGCANICEDVSVLLGPSVLARRIRSRRQHQQENCSSSTVCVQQE